ncbi:hypothetical protein [Saccharolobus shibatae]|nr:hypothetical protein [Saccharolobus shibatae]QXJ28626.1 hypothetical protein J5U23_01495 [Saccharolobus shibatae B12]
MILTTRFVVAENNGATAPYLYNITYLYPGASPSAFFPSNNLKLVAETVKGEAQYNPISIWRYILW